MADNVGIIGVLTDTNNADNAKTIVDKAELKSKTILLNKEIYTSFSNVQYIPYIMFVDKEGKVIGKDLSGKQSLDSIKAAVEIAIKEIEE